MPKQEKIITVIGCGKDSFSGLLGDRQIKVAPHPEGNGYQITDPSKSVHDDNRIPWTETFGAKINAPGFSPAFSKKATKMLSNCR